MMSPTETYAHTMQRIETSAERRAGEAWQVMRRELADVLDLYSASSPALFSALIVVIAAAARQMPNAAIGQAIYDAVTRLVETQIGRAAPVVEQTPMNYEPWRLAATGLIIGEALRMQMAGADEAAMRDRIITGRDGRASAWQLARNSLMLAVVAMVWGGGNGLVVRMGQAASVRDGVEYQKQAIAALDARTTPICRAVNHQIQPLDRPFKTIVGSQMNPPFHHRCRTAVVLYHSSFGE